MHIRYPLAFKICDIQLGIPHLATENLLVSFYTVGNVNPSRANPTKWSNILKRFVGNSR